MKKVTSTNSLNLEELTAMCPMQFGMRVLSGRWKGVLLYYIHTGLTRFGVLRKRFPLITTKMLSQQLRELETDGLVTRTVYAEVPPHVEYALTPQGAALIPILAQLRAWAEQAQQQAIAAAPAGKAAELAPQAAEL